MKLFRRFYFLFDAVKKLLIDHGMLRSILTQRCVDSQGNAVPWFSWPAIHFLDSLDLSRCSIFEFGSGYSTLYWGSRISKGQVGSYLSVENDPRYFAEMSRQYGFYSRCVHLREQPEEYARFPEKFLDAGGELFDITVVDGMAHHKEFELEMARRITDSNGFIIVDDANWLPFLDGFCEVHSFARIDFVGPSPMCSYTKVTSILFRDPARFMGNKITTPRGGLNEYTEEIK